MSMKTTISVTCPYCQTVSEVEAWQSIDTSTDPSLKEAVRQKAVFRFCCPSCLEETLVDYGFLYHQPEDKWLIEYAPEDSAAQDFLNELSEEGDPLQQFVQDGYLIRLVRTQNELVEKLLIFDAGLDDRLIEIYKVLVLLRYQETHKDIEAPALYFYAAPDKKPEIQVLVNDTYDCSTTINPELYQDLQNRFGDRLTPINEDTPLINEQWAFSFLS